MLKDGSMSNRLHTNDSIFIHLINPTKKGIRIKYLVYTYKLLQIKRCIRNYIKILPFNKQNLFIHFFLIVSIYTLKISEHWVEIKVRPPTYKTVK